MSATVNHNRCSYYVTVYFDRGKITFAHCSCDQSMNWCAHVIATCLARIKDKNTVTIRMPVSDSLHLLDQDQLLKLAHYLLYKHQNEGIIETAQQLLDKLLSKEQKEQEEDINAIAGAPDSTAGPGKTVYLYNRYQRHCYIRTRRLEILLIFRWSIIELIFVCYG